MKRLFSSWKFYIAIITIGFALWIIPELVDLIKPKPSFKVLKKSIPFMMIEPSRTLYQEIKEWAKIAGQILTGLGGVGGSAKILIDLFRRKQKNKR
jgi:hypothetical protein